MEIFLIRHTTPLLTKGLIYGRTEVALAETFREEKEEILSRLPPDLDAVYSSPSLRCSLLAQEISPSFRTDQRLLEVNFGLWEGKTWETVNQEELKGWMNDFVNVCPPEGESMIQMQSRVLDFWLELCRKPFSKTVVVTHGGVIRVILAHLQKKSLKNAFEIKVGYGETFNIWARSYKE